MEREQRRAAAEEEGARLTCTKKTCPEANWLAGSTPTVSCPS